MVCANDRAQRWSWGILWRFRVALAAGAIDGNRVQLLAGDIDRTRLRPCICRPVELWNQFSCFAQSPQIKRTCRPHEDAVHNGMGRACSLFLYLYLLPVCKQRLCAASLPTCLRVAWAMGLAMA